MARHADDKPQLLRMAVGQPADLSTWENSYRDTPAPAGTAIRRPEEVDGPATHAPHPEAGGEGEGEVEQVHAGVVQQTKEFTGGYTGGYNGGPQRG